MKATYDKSKIMKNAWYLKKVQPGKSLGDCLRKAWRNEKLAMLTAKICWKCRQVSMVSEECTMVTKARCNMNEVIQSTDRLTALLEEQAACIERIMAILDK